MFLKSPQRAPCLGRFENGSWGDHHQPPEAGGGEEFASSAVCPDACEYLTCWLSSHEYSIALLLKVWSVDQRHGHHLGAC